MSVLCLAATALLLASSPVSAGDWLKGKYGKRPEHMGVIEEMPFEETHYNHVPLVALPTADMPGNFTWCSPTGDNFCTPSWNQHIPVYCGACFAHGTLSMVQDRMKIMKGGGMDVMLSRQTFLNCAPFFGISGGCQGGDPIDLFKWMKDVGLPDETCMAYSATDWTAFKDPLVNVTECPPLAKCSNCVPIDTPAPGFSAPVCWPVEKPILYSVGAFGRVGCGPEAMMNEIYQRGPIVCSAATDSAFMYDYRSGVYTGPNSTTIDHNVEVVGWGVEDGIDYWHVRNSWGSYWGELGFFKLAKGDNLLRMEECDCWYANPTWDTEQQVIDGKLVGTMYGIIEPEGAADEAAAAPEDTPAQRAQANLLRSFSATQRR